MIRRLALALFVAFLVFVAGFVVGAQLNEEAS